MIHEETLIIPSDSLSYTRASTRKIFVSRYRYIYRSRKRRSSEITPRRKTIVFCYFIQLSEELRDKNWLPPLQRNGSTVGEKANPR